MNIIRIEEYREAYLDEINSLMLSDKNYILKISDARHCLLLLENEIIIGIGSIWDNRIHPYRDYISVYIIHDKRGKGLGKLLFHELERRYKLKKLQAAFDSNNINAVIFAVKCGFQLVRKCYCYGVNKEILKSFNYDISRKAIRLCNLSENQFEDVIILQHEDYNLNHKRINPLSKNMTLEEWKKIISENLIIEDSYVLINNNDIDAYLLCYEIDETSIAVGYTGSRCSNVKDYKAFLYGVMKQLFTSYKQIELEIDDCDVSANILGQLFSYKPNVSWDTYVSIK